MGILDKSARLKKELTLVNVFAISLGATLSSGFFLLPGLAAAEAGPAVVVVYIIALLPLIPGILSKLELSTAMPRAGGVYYFLDRSLGPVFGTIGGIGTWLALVLKVAFALVGMGAYLIIFWPNAPLRVLAIVFAIAFGLLNVVGTKRTGGFQVVLVIGLLIPLIWFMARGVPAVSLDHFDGFFAAGPESILSAAGLVCISYIGLTKVASVSEEVREPEKTLPRGMFLAIATATLIYAVGTWIMVGVLPPDDLHGSLTPVADAANVFLGTAGVTIMSIAAILAFFSVANAGILAASRYPLAMSRDALMPSVFQKLGRFGTPSAGIALTVASIIVTVVLLDPLRIAKLAGAFQLLLFAMNCFSVIIMRASRIESYDPGYRAPFYPWMQIIGILAPFVLIAQMGWLPVLFSAGLVIVGVAWYIYYARPRVSRHGAIQHVFGRTGAGGDTGELDRELRSILKEKGLRKQDPFDEIIVNAIVMDMDEGESFEHVVERVSEQLARNLPSSAETLAEGFLQGTRTGATPVTDEVALPHMRVAGITRPRIAIVRCREGMQLITHDVFGEPHESPDTHALFFLVSPEDDPGQHLRLLAQLASRVEEGTFMQEWLAADDVQAIRHLLVRHDRDLSITLLPGTPAGAHIDKPIKDLGLPEGSLVAIVQRGVDSIVPSGGTVLEEFDVLTIIGNEAVIRELHRRYD